MERFVQAVVGGGVVLVGGLWLAALTPWRSTPWLLGVGLALLGTASLAGGVWSELDR